MASAEKKFPLPLMQQEVDHAKEFLQSHKVVIFVVAYQAEKYIEQLLKRIPVELLRLFAEIFIIDDSSRDRTFEVATQAKQKFGLPNLSVYQTPHNRGYGGNQKLGYLYAIAQGYDVVILLHGDGQYPPEYLARLIAPFRDEKVDAVFGSRMMTKRYALQGGMPFYKWLGNQILTKVENLVLGTKLSEFHTGYRAYRTRMLKKIPFKYNDDGFHFDTEVIIQLLAARGRIMEVPMPTHYGDEACHVNGLKYAYNCVKSVLWYQLTKLGIFFDRRFDVQLFERGDFSYRETPNTVHQYMVKRDWKPGKKVLELNAGSGRLSAKIAERGPEVFAADANPPAHAGEAKPLALDLEAPFDEQLGKRQFDTVIMLVGLEHHNAVGDICERVSRILKPSGIFYVCTGNVVYFPLRFFFLLGAFHYGKRGILDRRHARLFTKGALVRLLRNSGFRVCKVRGFGPPLRDMISTNLITRIADRILYVLARISPSLFGYQLLAVAEKLDDVESVLERTVNKAGQQES